MNSHPDFKARRPEEKQVEALVMAWRMQYANDTGIPVENIAIMGNPSLQGDSYEVRLCDSTTGAELAKKNYYVDLNGVHEVDPRRK